MLYQCCRFDGSSVFDQPFWAGKRFLHDHQIEANTQIWNTVVLNCFWLLAHNFAIKWVLHSLFRECSEVRKLKLFEILLFQNEMKHPVLYPLLTNAQEGGISIGIKTVKPDSSRQISGRDYLFSDFCQVRVKMAEGEMHIAGWWAMYQIPFRVVHCKQDFGWLVFRVVLSMFSGGHSCTPVYC